MTKIIFLRAGEDELVVGAQPGEIVLEALLRSTSSVPFYCRAGICGQCKSHLVSGEVQDVSGSPQWLSQDELDHGHILMCRSRAITDCVIHPVHAVGSGATCDWPQSSVVSVCETLDSGVLHLRVEADEEQSFSFRAGEYTRLEQDDASVAPMLTSLPTKLQRLFPASHPGLPHIDFFIPGADQLSAFIASMRPGTRVRLAPPVGNAKLRGKETGRVVLIAESEGLGSVLGMLRALAATPSAPETLVFILGCADGPVETMISSVADMACIDLTLVQDGAALKAAVAEKLVQTTRVSLPAKEPICAYVKASDDLARLAREVLFGYGVRPWDVHVDKCMAWQTAA